jgi:hypothetical protein
MAHYASIVTVGIVTVGVLASACKTDGRVVGSTAWAFSAALSLSRTLAFTAASPHDTPGQ